MLMKKILLMCVGALLLLTVSVSGTLAMAADDDVAGVSTGQVNIKLLQHRRGSDGALGDFVFANLVDLGQSVLYPAYSPDKTAEPSVDFDIDGKPYKFWSEMDVVGAVDQIVRVKNAFLFNSDAYVRVFFAFEGGAEHVLLNVNETNWTWELAANDVAINRNEATYNGTYDVYVATYKTVLKKGSTTEPCLLQMALNGASTDHAFFAQVGDTYEVLVYAQAIEAKDGEITLENFEELLGDFSQNKSEFFSNIDWAASSELN